MLVQKAVIKNVQVAELNPGDRILQDVVGYKSHIMFFQGRVLNNRDIAWLREKLKEAKPKLASERYQTKRKSPGAIRDKDGNVLVKAGVPITDEALAPLLKQGFTRVDGMESGVVIYTREATWPDDRPWRIDQFNPAVKVETTVTINDEIQETPEDLTKEKQHPANSGSSKPSITPQGRR